MTEPQRRKRNKPSVKTNSILQQLRAEITRGQYPPGERLPRRQELEERFSAGPPTIQKVMDVLMDEGFIESKGRSGTFVVERPPHLFHYALVFPFRKGQGGWSQFYTNLMDAAVRLEKKSSSRIVAYYEKVSLHPTGNDFNRLLKDIRSHKLAGIIFASPPYFIADPGFAQSPPLPCVAIMKQKEFPKIPVITLDGTSFLAQALDYFREKKRRRIAAVITPRGIDPDLFGRLLSERQMQSRPQWTQCVPLDYPQGAVAASHLLLDRNLMDGPDALIIGDDNLLGFALEGVAAAGRPIPDEIEIVAHCNIPLATGSPAGVKRLGYDTGTILGRCIEVIEQQRCGTQPADITAVEAVFPGAGM